MWDFKSKSFLHDLKQLKEKPPVLRRGCDIEGCPHLGEFKAPKSRYDLRSYFWFCIDHVRQYNQQWDFFKGMSPGEIENHVQRATVWERPTWRMTQSGFQEGQATRQKIYEHFTQDASGLFGDFSFKGEAHEETANINVNAMPHPTLDALATLDLAPPVEWDEVKARYKALAKKYHPDTNKGDAKAEEMFKKINIAYSLLKLSWQNYLNLDER